MAEPLAYIGQFVPEARAEALQREGRCMRYRMLGRLEVWDGQQWREVSAAKQRAALALLLINANQMVRMDAVMAELWGDRPPATAEQTLRVYISRLRRAFAPVRDGLLTRDRSYELRVAPGDCDRDRFQTMVAAGLDALAGGSIEEAIERLEAAIRLWRGEPLADLPPSPVLAGEVHRLSELRLVAVEALVEARLAVGQRAELVAELRGLVDAHPLRERLWYHLMTALHGAGRRAEALATYQQARRLLAEELGLEPGEDLLRLHREVLHGVVVVTGPAGVGRSTSAGHAAHLLRERLPVGDLAVRASVRLSYEVLDAGHRQAFRMLGMLDAATFPGWVLGPLLDADPASAHRIVEALVDCRLLEGAGTDGCGQRRYRFHDLIRLYARERAGAEDPAAVRSNALRRLCAAYVDLALRAQVRSGSGFAAAFDLAEPGWRLPGELAGRLVQDPMRWLAAERAMVDSLVAQAVDAKLSGLAWRLAAAMATLYEIGGHFDDWRRTHELALTVVSGVGDRAGEAVLHRNLGELHTIQDRYPDAIASFEAALAACRVTDRSELAAAAAGLGVLHRIQGRYRLAESYFRQSLTNARVSGNVRAVAYALTGLSGVHLERGELRQARRRLSGALAMGHAHGFRFGEAAALRGLGMVDLAAGRLVRAAERMWAAHAASATHGDRVGEVHALHWVGHIADVRGETRRAAEILDSCLHAYRQYGERFGEALTLRTRGELDLYAGRPELSLDRVAESLAIWLRIGSPYWTARTEDTRAAALTALGRLPEARATAARAAALRVSLGLPPHLPAATHRGRPLGGHLHRP